MPSPSSLNPQYQSLNAGIFNYNNWGSYVADLNRDWGAMPALLDNLNGNSSHAISDPQGQYIKMVKPRQAATAIVASVAQAGANLNLTFTDVAFTGARVKDTIRDANYNYGQVISVSPGAVTIQPTLQPLALLAASHFLVNSYIDVLYDSSGNHNSTGKTNLYEEKVPRYNYSAVNRASHQMSRREKFNSRMGPDGIAYYWNEGEDFMIRDFTKKYSKKVFFGVGGQFNGVEGQTNDTEGVRAAIRNQGGWFVSSTAQLVEPQWNDMLNWTSTKYSKSRQEKLFFMGRDAWTNISSFYANDINFTVSNSTDDGQQLNFDVISVVIGGIKAKIMVESFFNDPIEFPSLSTIPGVTGTRMSNTICMMDIAPIPADNERGFMPAMEKFHFSNDRGGMETIYKIIGGMTGGGPGNGTGPSEYNNYQLTSNPVDGCQFEMLSDGGCDCQADSWAWFELAA